VTRVALDCLPSLGEGIAPYAPSLSRFLDHSDPGVRRAAIEAGATGVDWRAAIAAETDPVLRGRCAQRLGRDEGTQAIPVLVDLLGDPDWRVRAAASQALVEIGAPAQDAVKPLVHDPDRALRTAAVQVLLALGEDAWLKQALPPVR
jgi:HEAT repeat protein